MPNLPQSARETSNQKSKILSLLSNESVKQKVMLKLQSENIFSATIKLELVHLEIQIFKIEESDILKVCECFGEVISIEIANNTAVIVFKELVSAYFALQVLNQKELPELNATLMVSWWTSPVKSREPFKELPINTMPIVDQKAVSPSDQAKFTCRFNINIENDKKFKVVRKLLGTNGYQMKKIIEKCSKVFQKPEKNIVKLRLRGKGSGFKEGPTHEESNDSLHLWISTKDQLVFTIAVTEIEKLLTKIYADFDAFCIGRGKPAPMLKVEKFEIIQGSEVKISEEIWKEFEKSEILNEQDIEDLIEVRNEARRRNDFQEADRIRELLNSKGIALVDEKGMKGRGTEVTMWRFV